MGSSKTADNMTAITVKAELKQNRPYVDKMEHFIIKNLKFLTVQLVPDKLERIRKPVGNQRIAKFT